MLGAEFPGTAQEVVSYLIDIATLDLLPTDEIFETVFDDGLPDEDEDELPEEQLDTGYESEFFAINAGSLLIFFLIQVLLLVLAFICKPCESAFTFCRTPIRKVKAWLLFNPILRLLLEATLDFTICVFI